jgi:diaminopimelate epimerase
MTLIPPPSGRPFIKIHGLHNHFVIVDGRVDSFTPSKDEIARICDVTVGIGADQLIVIEPPVHDADVFMRILNTDGREVEACGNATRCVAWLLFAESGSDHTVIETLAGQLRCYRAGDNLVTAEMGTVTMDWQSVPLAEERDTLHLGLVSGALADPVAVNVGNPHAVFFVDDLDAVDFAADAPEIQRNELFPDGANVGVAELLSAQKMRLSVYERGVGLTMACGSGACAAVFAARQRGLVETAKMEVVLPGGSVTIEIRDDDIAVMTGPVAVNFSGNL